MSLISFELLSLVTSIIVIIYFKLTKRLILRLLSKIKIYLPFTDKDYEMLLDIKKTKSEKNAIVRSCDLDEYIAKSKDEKFSEMDVVLFFYLCCFFNLLASQLKIPLIALYHRFILKIPGTMNQPGQVDEDLYADYSFNLTASFSMITICFFVYILLKLIHRNGWKSYDAKMFYFAFAIFFILFSILQIFYPQTLSIDYEKIAQVVNDRLQKIAIKANANEVLKVDFFFCNVNFIKIFYSLLFGVLMGLLYRPCMRMSYFDNLLIVTTEKIENLLNNVEENELMTSQRKENSGTNNNLSMLSRIIKLKSILNILIFFMMIDPLLKVPLSNRKILPYTEITFTLFILSFGIIFEFLLGCYCIWYYSFVFHTQNYNDILAFCQKPSKEYFIILREKINYLNGKFWHVLIHIFYLVFVPLLLFIFYLNRSGLENILSGLFEHGALNAEYKFRIIFFMEGVAYVFLFAFISAKAIYLTGHLFYIQSFKKTANILY